MSVYSEHLGYDTAAAPGTVTLFTDPSDGKTTVLRDLEVALNGGGKGGVRVGPSGATSFVARFDNSAGAVTEPFQWRGRVVLLPGWVIEVQGDAGFTTAIASGYRLG